MQSLTLMTLPDRLAVCRTTVEALEPNDFFYDTFWSVTRTPDEVSVVLPEADARPEWDIEAGWRCLKVAGPLDFSLVGILAELSRVLAAAEISIFAISTYNTDYLLVKEVDLAPAQQALRSAGHHVE